MQVEAASRVRPQSAATMAALQCQTFTRCVFICANLFFLANIINIICSFWIVSDPKYLNCNFVSDENNSNYFVIPWFLLVSGNCYYSLQNNELKK